jgi:hypothetical protein
LFFVRVQYYKYLTFIGTTWRLKRLVKSYCMLDIVSVIEMLVGKNVYLDFFFDAKKKIHLLILCKTGVNWMYNISN